MKEGELLHKAVKKKGIGAENIARQIGISRQQLYNLFKAESLTEVYLDKLRSIGIFLGSGKDSVKKVPYLDIDAHEGGVSIFKEGITEYIKQYLEVPAFSDCDMYINVSGDSMNPKYCSGELIALKKIKDKLTIPWKEAYLIVTKEQRMLKYILPGKDKNHWTLLSENKKYPPMVNFPASKAVYLYMIKGKIVKSII